MGTGCTVLLRGGVNDALNADERNLQDAISACRALAGSPQVVPGGGAAEMHSRRRWGVGRWVLRAHGRWRLRLLGRC